MVGMHLNMNSDKNAFLESASVVTLAYFKDSFRACIN